MSMITFIIVCVVALVILFFAVRSSVRRANKITLMRRNEILLKIRYKLPKQLDFAYEPFFDTATNFGYLVGLSVLALFPVDLPAVFVTCFKLIIFFLAVYIMRFDLRTIWIHGVTKRPALCLNRETFQIFNSDIEWKAIQEIIFNEEDEGHSLTVNYIADSSGQIMSKGFHFFYVKDSYEVILPAVEKYWRICSGQTDREITYKKIRVL